MGSLLAGFFRMNILRLSPLITRHDFETSDCCVQVSCHLVPALVKLRKEGIDGNEKIKKYTFVPNPLLLLSVSFNVEENIFLPITCPLGLQA